jgi:hypothetical protein
MKFLSGYREDRADFFGAQSNYIIQGVEKLGGQVIPGLRMMLREIDSDLSHHLNGKRVDLAAGLAPCALNFSSEPEKPSGKAFSNLAPS